MQDVLDEGVRHDRKQDSVLKTEHQLYKKYYFRGMKYEGTLHDSDTEVFVMYI